MELRPNDLSMVVGALRKVTVEIVGSAGPNTITEFTATSDTLETSQATANGTTASFFLSADKTGDHLVHVEFELSSGERDGDFINVHVRGPRCPRER